MLKHARYGPLILLMMGACATRGSTDSSERPIVFDNLHAAALSTVSTDADRSAAATRHLRAAGPEGLAAMLKAFGDLRAYRLGEARQPDNYDSETADRALAAIDEVAGQHDGWASGLYWHTDREAALAAARESGKPVLNLWLLGRLDDEFC